MSAIIAPSLLAADFLHLGREIDMINQSESDWIHLDIMDGVFVPNISIGFPTIAQVSDLSQKPLDAHLMIVEPEKFITRFRDLGVFSLTVHYETCPHLHATIMKIKEAGMKAAVTINPASPVELLTDILGDVDMVLVMSVNPGFGGQKFIPQTLDKIQRLKKLICERNPDVLIQVDGGVNMDTGKQLVDAGADVLVAGNYIFKSKDPIQTIAEMKHSL